LVGQEEMLLGSDDSMIIPIRRNAQFVKTLLMNSRELKEKIIRQIDHLNEEGESFPQDEVISETQIKFPNLKFKLKPLARTNLLVRITSKTLIIYYRTGRGRSSEVYR
jgi:hypothetical protein